jgi:hypothetical protein
LKNIFNKIALIARRDADGAVIIAPKNFTTKNVKKGNIDSVLFSNPGYVSQGDPFRDPGRGGAMRTSKKDGHKEAGHDAAFKPAKSIAMKVGMPFAHMSDHNGGNKKNYKGPDGVIIGPINFLTNPPKKGLIGKG